MWHNGQRDANALTGQLLRRTVVCCGAVLRRSGDLTRWMALSGVGVLLSLVATHPALAWQQYRTSKNLPMRWPVAVVDQPIGYGLDATGMAADGLSPQVVAGTISAAFAQWQAVQCPLSSCQDRPLGLRFTDLGWQPALPVGLTCTTMENGNCTVYAPDGNEIVFVHQSAAWMYGSGVIALTTVTAEPATGAIVDADIEVNDAGFRFCVAPCGPDQMHLGAVILHEAGHLLGMDHSADPTAVMRAGAPKSIAAMPKLQSDDIAGICAVYPSAAPPKVCPVALAAKPALGACAAGRGGAASGIGLLVLALCLVTSRSSRHRP